MKATLLANAASWCHWYSTRNSATWTDKLCRNVIDPTAYISIVCKCRLQMSPHKAMEKPQVSSVGERSGRSVDAGYLYQNGLTLGNPRFQVESPMCLQVGWKLPSKITKRYKRTEAARVSQSGYQSSSYRFSKPCSTVCFRCICNEHHVMAWMSMKFNVVSMRSPHQTTKNATSYWV